MELMAQQLPVNTGSGGGGGGKNNTDGGAGGSGVVILRMPTAEYSSVITGFSNSFNRWNRHNFSI